jgi:hypothetical protein
LGCPGPGRPWRSAGPPCILSHPERTWTLNSSFCAAEGVSGRMEHLALGVSGGSKHSGFFDWGCSKVVQVHLSRRHVSQLYLWITNLCHSGKLTGCTWGCWSTCRCSHLLCACAQKAFPAIVAFLCGLTWHCCRGGVDPVWEELC